VGGRRLTGTEAGRPCVLWVMPAIDAGASIFHEKPNCRHASNTSSTDADRY
jgi:hypothetical protein